jgi:hypothetical protein
MRFRQIVILSRCLCARTVTAALAAALLLATLCQSQAADPEPKRVLMLQSFGLRFKPWTDFAELLRPEMTKQWGCPLPSGSALRRPPDRHPRHICSNLRAQKKLCTT